MTRYLFRSLLGQAAAVMAIAALCIPAQAGIVVDVDGFESSAGYSTTFMPVGGDLGQLEGQVTAFSFPNGTWQRPLGTGPGSATIVDTINSPLGPAGTQAVQVAKGAGGDDRWGILRTAGEPNASVVCVTWDMMIPAASGSAGEFGPFFGVETYDADMTPDFRHGMLGVDSTTGAVLIGEAGSGNFISPDGTSAVTFGEWNRFDIVLDFASDTYRTYLNGSLLAVEGFVSGSTSQMTDAPIAALAEGMGALQDIEGIAYFDNYMVHEGATFCIPEPSSLALLGLSVAGFCGRFRRLC